MNLQDKIERVRTRSVSPLSSIEVAGNAPNRSYIYRVKCAVCGHTWQATGYRLSQHGCDVCARRRRRKDA